MPLYYSASVGAHARLGLWRISESVKELEATISVPNESEIPRHEPRRREFLASRCLVDHLLQEHTGRKYKGVLKTPDGAPYVLGSKLGCSIAHDTNYAAAFIHEDQAPGIDIAEIDSQVLGVMKRFLSKDEQKACRDTNSATLYWATKEAIYKRTKGQLKDFKSMHIEAPLRLEAKGRLRAHLPEAYGGVIEVGYFFLDDYVVAYTPSEDGQPLLAPHFIGNPSPRSHFLSS